MKCHSCDIILSDFEATRRGKLSGQFLDLCNKCIKDLNIETIDRNDLYGKHQPTFEDPEYDAYGVLNEDEYFPIEDEE